MTPEDKQFLFELAEELEKTGASIPANRLRLIAENKDIEIADEFSPSWQNIEKAAS